MTVQELAAFNTLNDLYFWAGVFLSLLFSGFFKTLSNSIAYRFERPRRIRYRNMNGRAERKDDFEYLYLFKGEYYSLEQRDFLIKQSLEDLKKNNRINKNLIFVLILFVCLMVYSIYLTLEKFPAFL
jgi:hypothetical protein